MILACETERRWLSPLRALQWRSRLTVEQYVGRNFRLFAHPYAKQIRTYVWKMDNGEICSSFDALEVNFLVNRPDNGLHELSGTHVASVLTIPERRGQGFAKQLLTAYFEKEPQKIAFLNSGIGTDYYETLGFRVNPLPASVVDERVRSVPTKSILAISLSAEEFGKKLRSYRRRQLLKQSAQPAVSLLPSDLYLDWHLERYRYFSELARQAFPESVFWELENNLVATLPDFVQSQLDCLWIGDSSSAALAFVHSLATKWGLERVKYVLRQAPFDKRAADIPMLRFPFSGDVSLIDPQLCDYW